MGKQHAAVVDSKTFVYETLSFKLYIQKLYILNFFKTELNFSNVK